MKISEAIKDLINSEAFKEVAKQRTSEGGKYRMFQKRFFDGELKNGAAIDMLLDHGYSVEVRKKK